MNKTQFDALIANIKEFFSETGKTKAVLGLSGGIDSAVVLALLAKTIGPENVTGLLMPNGQITKRTSTSDAKMLCENLKVQYYVVPIGEFLAPFEKVAWPQNEIAKANLNARIRAVLLYNYANSNACLVAGTGNKSEFYLGYFTKYGDAAADFFPIGALLKKEVRELAVLLELPNEFLDKKPSAELWPGQEDEKELGLDYETIDSLLPIILKEKESEVPPVLEDATEKIRALIKASEHKRQQAKIISV